MSEAKIEEDIKTLKDFILTWKDNRLPIITDYNIQAIENILADRAKLEKENKKLKNQEEKDFTLVYMQGYEACKTNLQVKANKYNSLVEKIKDKVKLYNEYLSEQAITSNPTLDAHYRDTEKQIIQALQELLEEEKE